MKRLSVFALIAAIVISMFTLCTAAAEAETTAADTAVIEETAEETDIAESKADSEKFAVNPMNFVSNLSYMGLGMLGIFIVIGLVMIVTYALNKFFSGKEKNEQ